MINPAMPRYAPDPPARRALEKLLAAAAADPVFDPLLDSTCRMDQRLDAIYLYCSRAYQLGRDRGRRETNSAARASR